MTAPLNPDSQMSEKSSALSRVLPTLGLGGEALVALVGVALVWLPMSAMMLARFQSWENWSWNGAGWLGVSIVLLPLLLGYRGLLQAWRSCGRPLLRPLLALVMGWLLGHACAVHWFLVVLNQEQSNAAVDFGIVGDILPLPLNEPQAFDAWYDESGKLHPDRLRAWCDRASPMVRVFRTQAMMSQGSSQPDRALLAGMLDSVLLQQKCQDPEEYVTNRHLLSELSRTQVSHHDAIIQAWTWLPPYAHLAGRRAKALAMLPLSAREWCERAALRRHDGPGEASLSECAREPMTEVATWHEARSVSPG